MIMNRFIRYIIICFALTWSCVLQAQSDRSILKRLDKGDYCVQSGYYPQAISFYSDALARVEKKYGKESELYTAVDYLVANSLKLDGQIDSALVHFQNILRNEKRIYGDGYETALTSYYLSECYDAIGDLHEPLRFCKYAYEILKDHPETKPSFLLTVENNLALYYFGIGDYENASSIMSHNLSETKSLIGDGHDYFVGLGNLSAIYRLQGNTTMSLRAAQQAVNGFESINEDNSIDYLYSICYLANALSQIGDKDEASRYMQKAKDGFEELLGAESSEFASILDNIAIYYATTGEYDDAIACSKQALSIREKIEQGRPLYGYSLNNLGHIYFEKGDYVNSIKYDSLAVDYRTNHVSDEINLASSLSNLSQSYFKLGRVNEAIDYGERAFSIRKAHLLPSNPDYLNSLHVLIGYYAKRGDTDTCGEYMRLALESVRQILKNEFKVMTAEERRLFWNNSSFIMSDIIEVCTNNGSPELLTPLYNAVLLSKGLLLSSQVEIEKSLRTTDDETLLSMLDELHHAKSRLEFLLDSEKEDEKRRIASIEADLMSSMGDPDGLRSLDVSFRDIISHLHDGEVAVEYISSEDDSGITSYYALIVRKEWDTPVLIKLATEETIRRFARAQYKLYDSSMTADASDILINPILEFVNKDETLFFSPTGLLNIINIEALCNNDARTINTIRLSSTREIMNNGLHHDLRSSVIYGGLIYDETPENNDGRAENRGGWRYLPGTATEAATIHDILSSNNIKSTLFTKEDGTESSFKAFSGNSPDIIHIATHGFYLESKKATKNKYYRQWNNEGVNIVDEPLSRSGLIMSASQRYWLGDETEINEDDNILLSSEISHLNLSNTKLIVLSACQSGLGDISEDEVYGLQRAFKGAGVQTLIVSLWEVDDDATQKLMSKLYTFLIEGHPIRDAFNKARAEIRALYPDPYYWASFIIID